MTLLVAIGGKVERESRRSDEQLFDQYSFSSRR